MAQKLQFFPEVLRHSGLAFWAHTLAAWEMRDPHYKGQMVNFCS
jgi:hypothetical protein